MIVGFSLVIFVIIFVFLVLSSFLMLLIEYWEILRVLVMFLFLMVFFGNVGGFFKFFYDLGCKKVEFNVVVKFFDFVDCF